MIFRETGLFGCYLIEPEPLEDERGLFARTFDAEEFRCRGLNPDVAQCSVSHNHQAGTLRGLHYQAPPHEEAKLVRCLRGRVFDVVVDVRPESVSYLQWRAFTLDCEKRTAVYVPEGFAHGFQTLVDDSELQYQISVAYTPKASRGIRWDDPHLGIDWPVSPTRISSRDAGLPHLVNTPPPTARPPPR